MSEIDANLPLGPAPTSAAPQQQRGRSHAAVAALLFLGRRLLFWFGVLLAIIFLTFLGLAMIDDMSFREALGEALLDTVAYLGQLLQGELGMSTAASSGLNPLPVGEVLKERLPRSLGLLGISLLVASVLGIFLGMRAARTGKQRSLAIILTTLIGISVPSFFAAFLLQWGVTVYTRWSGSAIVPVGGFGWDSHLVLPVVVLAARPLAQITRISFGTLRDVLSQDYVRTAHSKGLYQFQITWRHVMRNAAIPILTTIGVSFRFALSSLAVVELYFGWPGAGQLLLKSIARGDTGLTVALVLCFGILIIVVNLLLEISYRLLDPRLRDTPSFLGSGVEMGWRARLASWVESARDLVSDNPVSRWRQRRQRQAEPNPFAKSVARIDDGSGANQDPFVGKRSLTKVLRKNRAFTIGAFLVLGLFVIILFGPQLVTHNPYTTRGLEQIDGELRVPPFAPNEEFPWGTDALGRDMQSLIVTGAQQTLLLVILAVAARLVVGVALGGLAGWNNGRGLDRFIRGLADVIAAFPTLLLAMILVLALGIRNGMSTFIIAICFVGWGEIMQFVRSEVTVTRSQQFIESAVASGARTGRIFNRHLLPVMLGGLISIAALEISAVLMLLGELGFLSIFIGGGAFIELPGVGSVLYSDVPEWGALLSNVRYQARPFPWTGVYPMLAFFLTIFAFNLFGEGIRGAVDSGNLVINRFFNRWTVVLVVVLILGFRWLQNNSGATPFLRQEAQLFEGTLALDHLGVLTAPKMDGRSLGSEGQALAAQYIAEQFEALDLQAAGQNNTFFQDRSHAFARLLTEPEFSIAGQAQTLGQSFAAYPGYTMPDGMAAGPVTLIALGESTRPVSGAFRPNYPELLRMDLSEEIVLALSDREALVLSSVPKQALLVVNDDPTQLAAQYTLAGRSGQRLNAFSGNRTGSETPSIWISEETANRLLAPTGKTVAEVRRETDALPLESVMQLPTGSEVELSVSGELVERWPVQHVLGYIPGNAGYENCQDCLDKELVVVMVQYDTPPLGPDGTAFEAANDNASGVAVMLEAIRVLQTADYQPSRSFLFIAYSGEGLDGGEPVNDPDIMRFLQAKTGFARTFEPVAIVQLRGVGDGSGERLEVAASGSLRLADVMDTAVNQTGSRSVRGNEAVDISQIYEEASPGRGGSQSAPVVRLSREGWQATSRLASDTSERIVADDLGAAGRALAMALMILGQERQY